FYIYDYENLHKKRSYLNVERACCFTSLRGSMTLESSLIVPIFIIIMTVSMMFGEIILVKGQMYHGLTEAAKIAAVEEYYVEKKKSSLNILYITVLQRKYSNKNNYPGFIKISNLSFSNSKLLNDQDEVELHMTYDISISYPFFKKKKIRIEETVYQKAFTGYRPTAFELGEGYAYVTKYGNVYHTSLQCSHIMLRVTGSSEVGAYIQGKDGYKPCSKCAKNCSGKETQLYIPKEGDCYHTSLTCSGLTRLIRKVTIWEIGNRKPCSRCGN
ncbi:MAG: hypothetical protein Q4E73_11950, partial [Lachnospiraceae bacterium]|nr:hypothetical protein [Lachnospiraceae bacterium]